MRAFSRLRSLLHCLPIALALCAAAPASAQLQKAFSGTLVNFWRGEPAIGLLITNGAETETIFCYDKYGKQCSAWAENCEKFGRKITVRYVTKPIYTGAEGEDEMSINSAQDIEWPATPFDRELNQALCEANGLGDKPNAAKINSLGEWYERGQRGLPKDMKAAVVYYLTAAKDGNAAAKRNYETLCSQLKGEPLCPQSAATVKATPPAVTSGASTSTISGDINAAKAIPLLYGHASVKADDGRQFTLWRNVQLPKGWDSLLDDELLVSKVFEQKYSEGGKDKYILLTQAQNRDWALEDGGCHACAPIIGAAIFTKNHGQWTLEAENKFMGTLGGYGSFGGETKLVRTGSQKHGLQNKGGDMSMGCIFEAFFIIMPHKGSIEIFSVGEPKESCFDTENDKGETYIGDSDASLRFDAASKGDYYDAIIQYKSTSSKNSKPVTVTEKYRFDGSAYKPF